MREPQEVLPEVLMHHLCLLPLQQIPPGHDLHLPVPDHQLLDQRHLLRARIQRLARVDFPLLELVQHVLEPAQDLHHGRTFRGESREDVVREEDRVLKDRGLAELLCDVVAAMDESHQGLIDESSLLRKWVKVEVVGGRETNLGYVHDRGESVVGQGVS